MQEVLTLQLGSTRNRLGGQNLPGPAPGPMQRTTIAMLPAFPASSSIWTLPPLVTHPTVADEGLACSGRKRDAKLRPSWLRLKIDHPIVVARQPTGDIEPEAGALSHRLGGKEGIE